MLKSLWPMLATLLFFCTSINAKISLPDIIGDHMVLQRNDSALLWGHTNRSKVDVYTGWNNKTCRVIADAAGNWKVMVPTTGSGGPYEIRFSDGDTLTISDIMLGEVWLLSGQSNMAMPLKGLKNQPVSGAAEALLESRNNDLRFFTVARSIATEPQERVSGNWQQSDERTAQDFSAIGYFYGSMLQKRLKVPVGVIVSAVGGTPIRSWMSRESLAAIKEISMSFSSPDAKDPTVLFNGMIHPLINVNIRGVLWYQGEYDRLAPDIYQRQLELMVADWRRRWAKDFPFYFVQIAPYIFPDADSLASARVREAQLKASRQIPNSAMVVTMDVGSAATVHPPEKKIVAQRLLAAALAGSYGYKELPWRSPEYVNYAVHGSRMMIAFSQAGQGLISKGPYLNNFEIAGADRIFYPATAIIKNNSIEVYSKQVQKPVSVRYAFKNFAHGDLFNSWELPASSFRTDNW